MGRKARHIKGDRKMIADIIRTGATYDEYMADKKQFYAHDVRYTEKTKMEGENFETTGVTYKKSVSFCTEDEKVWGTWMEIRTVRTEPIFEVMFTRHLGGNVYEQTAKKIGETEYEDVEYFVYGEGFDYPATSKFIHTVTKKTYEVA